MNFCLLLKIWVDTLLKINIDKIMKVSKSSQQNHSEAVTNENDKEIPRKRYISPEARQKIIDNLRLI